jgi:membrane protein
MVLWLELPFSGQALILGAMIAAGIVFTLLYKLAPHAPVPWNSALIGGLSAGAAWEAARHVYGSIAAVFYSANPIYGSVGIAPLFLMWIYVGWFIVLAGARLAYAVEHAEFHDVFQDLHAHPRSQELIAARIAALVSRAHLESVPGPTTKALSDELQLPEQRVRDIVHRLEQAGLLIVAQHHELHPASSPGKLTLADISLAMGGTAKSLASIARHRPSAFESIALLFGRADNASTEKLKGITWEELGRVVAHPRGKP